MYTDDVIIAVRDTGVGITKDKQSVIFDAFTQLDSSNKRLYSGMGLGLALVKTLVSLMGGVVVVDSLEGHGSTFTVRIPLHRVDRSRTFVNGEVGTLMCGIRGNDVLSEGPIVDASALPISVLCAEDNPVNQHLVREVCKRWGMRYTPAWNGRETLDILAKERFDAVLLDIQMPGVDGLSVMSTVRETMPHHPPVIVLTAYASAEDESRFKEYGVSALLVKPLAPEALREAIVAAVSDRRIAP
jgi:CheY-like chemotaxis protein